MTKALRRRDDGFVISYHEDLKDNPRFEVIDVKPGENPQPDEFLSPEDIEAKAAKAKKEQAKA